MTFEDPTQLARCIYSDCQAYRAGGTPFCAQHLREQETKSAGIAEPDVEAKVAQVRTEDDEHPGMVKVYDRETGRASWVPQAMKLIGQDPDTQMPETFIVSKPGSVPDYDGSLGRVPAKPDPTKLEPRWNGSQWVLEEKQRDPDFIAVRSLVRDLMYVLGIREEGGDDHA